MSQQRRYERGFDIYMDYWHRSDSLRRFIGSERARNTSMIDLDSVEYCWLCYMPLLLIELKREEATQRIGTVTARLAAAASVPAYLVTYAQEGDDIVRFSIQQWHPMSNDIAWMTPTAYAEWLWSHRMTHLRSCERPEATHWVARYEAKP